MYRIPVCRPIIVLPINMINVLSHHCPGPMCRPTFPPPDPHQTIQPARLPFSLHDYILSRPTYLESKLDINVVFPVSVFLHDKSFIPRSPPGHVGLKSFQSPYFHITVQDPCRPIIVLPITGPASHYPNSPTSSLRSTTFT